MCPAWFRFWGCLCSLAEQGAGGLFRVWAALQVFEQSGNCSIWSTCGEPGAHSPADSRVLMSPSLCHCGIKVTSLVQDELQQGTRRSSAEWGWSSVSPGSDQGFLHPPHLAPSSGGVFCSGKGKVNKLGSIPAFIFFLGITVINIFCISHPKLQKWWSKGASLHGKPDSVPPFPPSLPSQCCQLMHIPSTSAFICCHSPLLWIVISGKGHVTLEAMDFWWGWSQAYQICWFWDIWLASFPLSRNPLFFLQWIDIQAANTSWSQEMAGCCWPTEHPWLLFRWSHHTCSDI